MAPTTSPVTPSTTVTPSTPVTASTPATPSTPVTASTPVTKPTPVTGISPVRLVDGGNACEGRVEVFYNNSWESVCDTYWNDFNAEVVCRQLGCGMVHSAPKNAYFGQGDGRILLDYVNCHGDEPSLLHCRHIGFYKNTCGHYNDASVICLGIPEVSPVRLVDGGNECEGRVEVFYNNSWESVCDTYWNHFNAEVVCRQLGCGMVHSAPKNAYFGQGDGRILLDYVNCHGDEPSLLHCRHIGFYNNTCGHYNDASVICIGKRVVSYASCHPH
ncbi:deleted in malignant brain tumors 1 protein-like [Ambystoma mexicanum]|uniref:deleted in malignant brain tumors 1 protein-like n=1 Tax=Ambystoma mexicanum TaxID=8296 RepID=UPI0037E84AD0